MKSLTTLFILLPLLFSCSSIAEKAQEAAAEKVAESLLGQDIDVGNLNDLDQNEVISELMVENQAIFQKVDGFKGSVNIQGDNIVIHASGDSENQKLVITLSGPDLLAQKPYSAAAAMYETGETSSKAMLILSDFGKDVSTSGYVLADGSITITSFSENELILTVDGHVASPMDLANGTNKKEIKGSLSLVKPIIQAGDKEISELVY